MRSARFVRDEKRDHQEGQERPYRLEHTFLLEQPPATLLPVDARSARLDYC